MYSQNFFPLWGAWADKLLREKAPHAVKIEDLPGYDGGSETFKQALWEFEENGFAKVDYFSGVTLTPQAVSFFMANILREPTGNFRIMISKKPGVMPGFLCLLQIPSAIPANDGLIFDFFGTEGALLGRWLRRCFCQFRLSFPYQPLYPARSIRNEVAAIPVFVGAGIRPFAFLGLFFRPPVRCLDTAIFLALCLSIGFLVGGHESHDKEPQGAKKEATQKPTYGATIFRACNHSRADATDDPKDKIFHITSMAIGYLPVMDNAIRNAILSCLLPRSLFQDRNATLAGTKQQSQDLYAYHQRLQALGYIQHYS